jgi:hypothetical protein
MNHDDYYNDNKWISDKYDNLYNNNDSFEERDGEYFGMCNHFVCLSCIASIMADAKDADDSEEYDKYYDRFRCKVCKTCWSDTFFEEGYDNYLAQFGLHDHSSEDEEED